MQNINLTNEDKNLLRYRITAYTEFFKKDTEIALKTIELKRSLYANRSKEDNSKYTPKESKFLDMINWMSKPSDSRPIKIGYNNIDTTLYEMFDSKYDYISKSYFDRFKQKSIKRMRNDFITNVSLIVKHYLSEQYTEHVECFELSPFVNYDGVMRDVNCIFDNIQSWWNHITQNQDITNYARRWNKILSMRNKCEYIKLINSDLEDSFDKIIDVTKQSKRVIKIKMDNFYSTNESLIMDTILFYLSRKFGYDIKKNKYANEQLKTGTNNYNYGMIEKIKINQNYSANITFNNEPNANEIMNVLQQTLEQKKQYSKA